MQESGIEIQFVELRDAETLGPYSPDPAAVLAVSARAGDTSLIDNVVLAPQITAAPRKIDSWST
jgi:pantothenate synthetase